MKLFTIFGLVTVTAVVANAAPQSGDATVQGANASPASGDNYDPYNPVPPRASPGCRTVPVSEKSIIYVEKSVQVCQDVKEIECGTCIQELGIRDASNVKGFNQCQIKYNDYDVELARSTEVILEETVCNDVTQQVCDSHWVIDEKGDKVWEEDPSTCKSFEVTKCEQVPRPHTSVDYVAATVSKPFEICCEVVRDECEIKHSKEPQQQEVHKYKEVCDVPDDVIVNRSAVTFGQ